ncbi:MAG TPA: DNA repair protein RecO [Chloroflexi bacterium]|nr:DNA repair protein RecO [Chloroflexota bacterium]
MLRERLYRAEAIVLRRMNLGEADRLLTLYTPEWGKIRVLAKGVRKPTSRKAGHLELFTHSRLLIAKGRSLDIVTQAETITSFLPLRKDLTRTSYAYYVAELVDRFLEEGEESPALFRLLLETLGHLSEAQDPRLVVRHFELHLLGQVGYRPELYRCLGCGREIEGEAVFSPSQGGVLCPPCGGKREGSPLSADLLRYLRLLQRREYTLCQTLQPSPEVHSGLERTTRHYISYILERRLRSLDFIDTLRREEEKPLAKEKGV